MYLVELQLTVMPESLTTFHVSSLLNLLLLCSSHISSVDIGVLAPDSNMPPGPSQVIASKGSKLRTSG